MLINQALHIAHLRLQGASLDGLLAGHRLQGFLQLLQFGLQFQHIRGRFLLVLRRHDHLFVEPHDVVLEILDIALKRVEVVADLLHAPLGDLDLLAQQLLQVPARTEFPNDRDLVQESLDISSNLVEGDDVAEVLHRALVLANVLRHLLGQPVVCLREIAELS